MFKNRYLDNFVATLFVLAVVGLMTLLPNILDPFLPVEKIIENMDLTDIYFSKIRNSKKVDTNIVVVNIAESRTEIAKQINIINSYNPAVIGIDAYFLKEKNPAEDFRLSLALSKTDNCVLASYFINTETGIFTLNDPDFLQLSMPVFLANNSYGFINFVGDGTFKTIRSFVPSVKYEDSVYHSFGAVIASKYNPEKSAGLFARENESEIINFLGDFRRFMFLDIDQVFDTLYDKSFLRNKIILMGYHGSQLSDSMAVKDKYFTPLNRHNVSRGLPDIYGVVIHANIISMILNADYINLMPKSGIFILSFILCFLNISFFEYIRKRFPQMYGGELKIFIIFEFVVILFLVFLIFDIFYFKINVLFIFFVVILSQDISEIYFSSFKSMINKLKGKKNENL
ncbi:CHASE2 domain-containing protein [Bacteroidota bacterium]